MPTPQMFKGESITRLIQGAVLGVILTLAGGFFFLGWVAAGTAEQMAADRASAAVVAAYAPVCVERFYASATEEQRAAFSKEDSWSRNNLIEEAGFATTPGSDSPNGEVADECAKLLTANLDKKS